MLAHPKPRISFANDNNQHGGTGKQRETANANNATYVENIYVYTWNALWNHPTRKVIITGVQWNANNSGSDQLV